MFRRLNYLWRLIITGLCFASFGLGGAALSMLAFPFLRLLSRSETEYHLRAQNLIHYFFAFLTAFLDKLGVMRLELHNTEALRHCGNVLVLANHPSFIDIVVLLSLLPHASCVVNSRLWRSPFWGGMVRAAGYIRSNTSETLINDCVDALSSEPLIIFPEGTRSIPGKPLRISRGAAHISIRSGCDIMPIILTCQPPTLTKGTQWYHIPGNAFTFRLEVRPLLKVSDCIDMTKQASLASRQLTAYLEHYFTTELNRHGCT